MGLTEKIKQLLSSNKNSDKFLGRQLMLSKLPNSHTIENYFNDNGGKLQKLDGFPMLRFIYDQMPEKLLLKCSRKVLKSTLVSNMIALNMLRWNYYNLMYIAPSESQTKYFSNNYITPRFDSPEIKKILHGGWSRNDVFEKTLAATRSSVLCKYVKDDATRVRGPAADQIILDEVQDISDDQIPIIQEVMSLSKYKREVYSGTPLTLDNTLHARWEKSNFHEYFTKCTSCNHWNALTIDNNPLEMIQPHGYSCSKCKSPINTLYGEWVSFGDRNNDVKGFHLAQPMLPHFNQNPKEWKALYRKIQKVHTGEIEIYKIFNEVFGLAYDVGQKPITLEELKELCVLGRQKDDNNCYRIYDAHKTEYAFTATGVDWGVSQVRSRTVEVHAGMRKSDGVIEVWFSKIRSGQDHKEHIREIASLVTHSNGFCAADSGPDPIRGIELAELTSPDKTSLAQYVRGKFVQRYNIPAGAIDWRECRLQLHKSDCMSLVFRLLRQKKILFPCYEDMEVQLNDVLNEFIEVKEDELGARLFYRHAKDQPDDFLHALLYAVVQLLILSDDPVLRAPSSSSNDPESDESLSLAD